MQSKRLWSVLIGLTLISVAWLWWTWLPLGVPGEWEWDRIAVRDGELVPRAWGLLLTVAVAGIYVFLVGFGASRVESCSRIAAAAWLAGLVCAGFVWLWTVQEHAAAPVRLGKAAWVLYYPGSSGYFTVARYEVPDTVSQLRTYEARMSHGDVLHVGTHPPGLFVAYRVLINLCERSPRLRYALLRTAPDSYREAARMISEHSQHSHTPFLEQDHAVLWLAALIVQLMSALTVVPLYTVVRRTCARRASWLTVALWPLVPALGVFLPKSDALYPCLAMWLVWMWLEGWDRRSRPLCFCAGFLLWLGLFFSLAFLPVALLCLLMTLPDVKLGAWFKKVSGTVAGTARDQPSVGARLRTTVPDTFLNHAKMELAPTRTIGACPSFRRSGRNAVSWPTVVGLFAWGGLGFTFPVAACRVWWSVNMIHVWLLNYHNHAGFYDQFARTYWKWLLANPLELIWAVGTPVAVLAGSELLASFRQREPEATRRPMGRTSWSVAVVLALLWLSGKNMGELARLWIVFLPWLVWLAAGRIERIRDAADGDRSGWPDRTEWLLLGAQVFICVATVYRVDGFHLAHLILPGSQ